MNIVVIYAIILLTVTWIILSESITVMTVIYGIIISAGCLYASNRLLPAQKIKNVKIFRLSIYLFYLIGRIYFSSFKVIKLIFSDPEVDIVKVKTQISNKFLRTLLANSISLPPGTISLDLKDDTITVLRLKDKTDELLDSETNSGLIMGKFEKMLLKMQK